MGSNCPGLESCSASLALRCKTGTMQYPSCCTRRANTLKHPSHCKDSPLSVVPEACLKISGICQVQKWRKCLSSSTCLDSSFLVVPSRQVQICKSVFASSTCRSFRAVAVAVSAGRTRPRLGSGGHAMAVTRVLRTPLQVGHSGCRWDPSRQGTFTSLPSAIEDRDVFMTTIVYR